MKLFFKSKDGGPESNVTGYWLIEWKKVFSVVLLKFDKGTREAFHDHAFHALSWVITGKLTEECLVYRHCVGYNSMHPSIVPVYTSRNRMHKVHGETDSTWVLSFRGPWNKTWHEYLPGTKEHVTLSSGRFRVK